MSHIFNQSEVDGINAKLKILVKPNLKYTFLK